MSKINDAAENAKETAAETINETAAEKQESTAKEAPAKSNSGNKQNMICIYHSEFCINIAAFNNWKNIALNTFPAYILTVTFTMNCNFINFVDKNNSALLNAVFSDFCNFIAVNHTV